MKSSSPKPRVTPNRTKRPETLPLAKSVSIPILYEDREIMAIDKPAGWMVTTPNWSRTKQNLQREIEMAIERKDSWVTRKRIRFLRFIHRLDRETSGVLLLAKTRASIARYSRLFSSREIRKVYACVVTGRPPFDAWKCDAPLGPTETDDHRMRIDPQTGQASVTYFKRIHSSGKLSLVLAAPMTGRTHQIRVHLSSAGHGIVGDPLYPTLRQPNTSPNRARGSKRPNRPSHQPALALRAWGLHFVHPSQYHPVHIEAEIGRFLSRFFQRSTNLDLPEAFDSFQQMESQTDLPTTTTGKLHKSSPA